MRKIIVFLMSMVSVVAISQGMIEMHSHITTSEFVSALEKDGRLLEVGFPLPKWDAETQLKAENNTTNNMNQTLYITIGEQTLPVTLVDNAATQALVAALTEASITYEADDYGGFEKVGDLGPSLPTNNEQITTEAGDVMLYNGSSIVLFYGSNSWSYTRLGRIQYDSLDALKTFLKAGQGRVSVTLSFSDHTGISSVQTKVKENKVYTLKGTLAQDGQKGIVIQNGKKQIR